MLARDFKFYVLDTLESEGMDELLDLPRGQTRQDPDLNTAIDSGCAANVTRWGKSAK